MANYVDVDYVQSLSPQAHSGSTILTADIKTDSITATLKRMDKRCGQYFATGYDGNYTIKKIELKDYGRVAAVPRLYSLDTVSIRRGIGEAWETLDTGMYEGRSELVWVESGFDTVEFSESMLGYDVRLTGKVGYGHGTGDGGFTGDAVPEDLKIEAAKQCRVDISRLPIGGSSGSIIGNQDMAMDMDGFAFLLSVSSTLKSYTDPRRLAI